jgi:hypothetical protein
MAKGFAYRKGCKPPRPGMAKFKDIPIQLLDPTPEEMMQKGEDAIQAMQRLYNKNRKPPDSFWLPGETYQAYRFYLRNTADCFTVAGPQPLTGPVLLMFRGIPVYYSNEVSAVAAMYGGGHGEPAACDSVPAP